MQSLRSAIPFFPGPRTGSFSHSYLPLSTSSNRSSASSGHSDESGDSSAEHLLSTFTNNAFAEHELIERDFGQESTSISVAAKQIVRRNRVRTGLAIGGAALVALGTAFVCARYALAQLEDGSIWPAEPVEVTNSPLGVETGEVKTTASDIAPLGISDPTYNPFRLSDLPPHPEAFPVLRPSRFLPTAHDCLELWFSAGEICKVADDDQPLGPEEQLDIIQLWVNGSDPLWKSGLEEKSQKVFGVVRDTAKHYRDQGGLQYSLRSAAENFARGGKGDGSYVRKIHVLTADMPCGVMGKGEEEGERQCEAEDERLGQIPSWMDKQSIGQQHADPATYQPALQIHHHAEVFRFSDSVFSSPEQPPIPWANESSWQEEALPNFNSFSIESRVGWLDDLADTCIQANDDMFFHLPLSTADFWSPMYGSMFRLDNQYGLQVKPILEAVKIGDAGEWGGLQHANWLLSKRFYARPRRYINHLPKTLTAPILYEAAILFPKDLALASGRSFRESRAGEGDIELAFLITWLRIERFREALLWTWVVGKVGFADDGMWAEAARSELKALFGVTELKGEVEVWEGQRSTLEHYAETYESAGWTGPKQTIPSFSSMDGHIPDLVPPRVAPNVNEHCTIDFEHCFSKEWLDGGKMTANEIFKRLTFDQWSCGDCLIKALVKQSGARGLSAFLPHKNAEVVVEDTHNESIGSPTPHLPLEREWQNNSFALLDVITAHTAKTSAPVNLRVWSMQLLSRYLYQLGGTPAEFTPVKSVGSAISLVHKYQTRPDVAMSCINDDEPDRQADAVGDVLRDWMSTKWQKKPWWERA